VSKLEKSFVVAVPRARVWDAFTDAEERAKWDAATCEIDLRPGGAFNWSLPNIESTGRVEEVEPERLFRHSDRTGPHANSEVTVTFEEVEGGTRVTITHAGFGDGDEWLGKLEGVTFGYDQALADLIAYLQTGVSPQRFNKHVITDPGMVVDDTPAGLEVRRVYEGGFAEKAGLRTGDLLLMMAGAPVYTSPELWVVLRLHGPGDKVDVEYIHDGARRSGSGALALLTA
jgi:uncharacterized protein YndB with AHSA1/START domain